MKRLRDHFRQKSQAARPQGILVAAFLATILAGTLLLWLPFASASGAKTSPAATSSPVAASARHWPRVTGSAALHSGWIRVSASGSAARSGGGVSQIIEFVDNIDIIEIIETVA